MTADAYLVETLITGALGAADGKGEKAFEQLSARYTDALANIQVAPKELDSVAQQLCLLALLFDAKGKIRPRSKGAKADGIIAQRLRRLADSIRAGSCKLDLPSPRAEKKMPSPKFSRRRRRR